MIDRFVINDLCDRAWSVTWPGHEYVLCDNEVKATNLLKILFEEVKVDEAVLAVKKEENSSEEFIMHISSSMYYQDPKHAGYWLASRYAVIGCKFPLKEQAEKFKDVMDKRLAWRRLSGKAWA